MAARSRFTRLLTNEEKNRVQISVRKIREFRHAVGRKAAFLHNRSKRFPVQGQGRFAQVRREGSNILESDPVAACATPIEFGALRSRQGIDYELRIVHGRDVESRSCAGRKFGGRAECKSEKASRLLVEVPTII